MKSRSIIQLIVALLIGILLLADADAPIRHRRHCPRARRPLRAPQPTPALNIQFGNDFENEQYLLGASLGLPLGRFWALVPGFQYYFTDDERRWQFDGDLLFKPIPRGVVYFGGGVATELVVPDIGDENMTRTGGNVLSDSISAGDEG